jgi:hypothetical protein
VTDGEQEHVFRLEILRSVRILGPDGIERSAGGSKSLTLLAYLAIEGPTPREHLARLLWPGVSSTAARHSLRQALSSTRKSLGVDPFEGSEEIRLSASVVATDHADFVAAMASGDTSSAQTLVRGRPLSGISAAHGRSLEEWLERASTRILRRYGDLLEREALSALERDDTRAIAELVARGTTAGLDPAVLRTTLFDGAGLPPWTLATVGADALESLALRIRAELPPSLTVVVTSDPEWVEHSLVRILSELPPAGRPRLMSVRSGAGRPVESVKLLLDGMLGLPGGAAVGARTSELLERLRTHPEELSTADDWREVEHAIADALDAVLEEGQVLVSIAADDVGILFAAAVARAIGIQGGEGLGLVIHGPDTLKLRGEPVRKITAAVAAVRMVEAEPRTAETVAHGPLLPAAPNRAWWLAAPVGILALLLVWFGSASARRTSPSLLSTHDVLFCSTRSGVAQYYRWIEDGQIVERFTSAETELCRGISMTADERTVYLSHEVERSVGWFAYPTDGPIRADQTGIEVAREPDYLEIPPGTTTLVQGVRGGDPETPPLLTVTAQTGWPRVQGHAYPWILTTLRKSPNDLDIWRTNLLTGAIEVLVDSPVSEGDGWLVATGLVFVRGAFGEEEDGSLELYMKDLETGLETRLTENSWNDYQLAVSRTGTHVCWQSEERGHYQSEIMIMELASRRSWNLTNAPGRDFDCRWTPDGTGVVYGSLRTGDLELFLQPMDGGPAVNITDHPEDDHMAGFILKGGGGR